MVEVPPEGFPLTADSLGTIVKHTAEVIDEFRTWGVRVHDVSRLSQILEVLSTTATAGSYPDAEEKLLLTGNAIQTAQEFIEIANILPSTPIAVVQADLQIALGGAFALNPNNKGPLQRQTQLWMGAMMVQAGAPTGVLERPTGKSPDFELENGNMRYAVEVKRPERKVKAAKLVRAASKQISSGRYHGGTIVVDLTDCLDPALSATVGRGEADLTPLNQEFIDQVAQLHAEIFDDSTSSIQPRRTHVFGLVAFARHQHWNLDDLSVPRLGRLVITIEYQKGGPRTLKAIRAKWLGGLVHDGIKRSAYVDVGQMDLGPLAGR